MLADIELDKPGKARAAIALALAGKLDDAATSKSGAVAVAAAGLAKELRGVLDTLVDTGAEDDRRLAEILGRPKP
jgi:hypothetical protein